jgi:hypothetical protein
MAVAVVEEAVIMTAAVRVVLAAAVPVGVHIADPTLIGQQSVVEVATVTRRGLPSSFVSA